MPLQWAENIQSMPAVAQMEQNCSIGLRHNKMLQIFHTVGSFTGHFFVCVCVCVRLCVKQVKEDDYKFARAFTKHSVTADGRAQILCS